MKKLTILLGVMSCLCSCTKGKGDISSNAGSATSSTVTITGNVSGPAGTFAKNWMDFVINRVWASNSGIANAKIEVYRVNTKGNIAGEAIAESTADSSGHYSVDIPADINLNQLSTVIVAKDSNSNSVIYSSFVNGTKVDIDLATSATTLAIKAAFMSEASAVLSKLSSDDLGKLNQVADTLFNTSNPPNFSTAYSVLSAQNIFKNKLNEFTATDLSRVDYSKVPPLFFPPLILDSNLVKTKAEFKVGDHFRIQARAIDLLSSTLEYKFKIKRNCVDNEVLQNWSTSDILDYTFQVSDVTNCTAIVVQVRNSDGIFLDGVDSDVESSISFTSQPTWTPTSLSANTPSARSGFTAIWSGTKMIIWGGANAGFQNGGGLYDPVTDQWTNISNNSAPTAREEHSAIWTGSKMIIWGGNYGQTQFNNGGIYTPSSDSWTSIAIDQNTPTIRSLHTAIWTGSKMIVWGGYNYIAQTAINSGAIYDPSTNSWAPMSTTNAPAGRYYHTAIWTGTKMIVWGGYDALNALADGAMYDPSNDTWTPISLTNGPHSRLVHQAAWTGTKMIIWGGMNPSARSQYNTGALYDPSNDTWSSITTIDAPSGRSWGPSSAWVGDSFIVWGGFTDSGATSTNTGGVYSPKTQTWQATTLNSYTPIARAYCKSVWTGSKFIVWGGSTTNTGGIYSP